MSTMDLETSVKRFDRSLALALLTSVNTSLAKCFKGLEITIITLKYRTLLDCGHDDQELRAKTLDQIDERIDCIKDLLKGASEDVWAAFTTKFIDPAYRYKYELYYDYIFHLQSCRGA